MRIAFIIARGDAFGGSSLHVCDMSKRLSEDGHIVRIFVGGSPDMEVPQRFAEQGLDFRCVPTMGREISPAKEIRAMIALRREIRTFGPDLVSTHASKAGALGRLACTGLKVPVIYTPHCWSFSDGFPHAGVYRWIEKALAPLATRIVTVCEQERRFGLSCGVGSPDRTICIHNGVKDIDVEGPATSAAARSGPPLILMVARFEQQKDHALLLRALAQIQDLDWALTCVGDGPLKHECETLANDLGIASRVEFIGYSSRVDQYLQRADIFALITHWEGFPRSVLEAMRAGLPIIVSDVGGCSEAVADGKTGRVVDHAEIQSVVPALRELLESEELRNSTGTRARELYEQRFTFEIMYGNYIRLYQSLDVADAREV